MFHADRQVEKIGKLWNAPRKKTSIFLGKSIRYPVKKVSQSKYAIKITQNTPPRALCRSMGWFLLLSGTLRASQNCWKWTKDFDKNHLRSLLGPFWDHFGRLIALILISAQSWFHFTTFWARFWDHLGLHFGVVLESFLSLLSLPRLIQKSTIFCISFITNWARFLDPRWHLAVAG